MWGLRVEFNPKGPCSLGLNGISVSWQPYGQVDTVDDINPAIPITYHNSYSLGSLRYCRIYIFTVLNFLNGYIEPKP